MAHSEGGKIETIIREINENTRVIKEPGKSYGFRLQFKKSGGPYPFPPRDFVLFEAKYDDPNLLQGRHRVAEFTNYESNIRNIYYTKTNDLYVSVSGPADWTFIVRILV